jgi:hypothetical protein
MHTVILAEFFQFPLQIAGVPEEYVVEAFAVKGSDQSFDEGCDKGT